MRHNRQWLRTQHVSSQWAICFIEQKQCPFYLPLYPSN
jgi:hypothetical protein